MPSLYRFRLKFDLHITENRKVPGDQIKNEMGGECGTYGRQESCMQVFSGET